MPSKGRFTNLLNSQRNYPYTLALSMPFNNNSEYILLADLVCGMTENNRMYLKSISKNYLKLYIRISFLSNFLQINELYSYNIVISFLDYLIYYLDRF